MRRIEPASGEKRRIVRLLLAFARDRQRMRSAGGKLAAAWRAGGLAGIWYRVRLKLRWGRVPYASWVKVFDTLGRKDRAAIADRLKTLRRPLISILMMVKEDSEERLDRTIGSLLGQLYPDWELILTADPGAKPSPDLFDRCAARDPRIRVSVVPAGSTWAAARNVALDLVRGEWVALLDPADELASHALYLVTEELNAHPTADLVYSDEDGLDDAGQRINPLFKPDWSPDLLGSQNYISRLAVYRTALVRRVGGFREDTKANVDYDLCLRCVALTTSDRIVHSPHVLYHRRAGSARSKGDAEIEAGRSALRAFVSQREPGGTVEPGPRRGTYRIRRPLPSKPPLASLIVPTRDGCALLRQCLDSIERKTNYTNYEILVVDNQSRDPETLRYFDDLRRSRRATILSYDHPFNYSAINNLAVAHARGEVVGLLNNDVEVLEPDWLSEMIVHALRPEVGAVGAKLYYPDGHIQHAGIIVGLGGLADHGHRHLAGDAAGYMDRLLVVQNVSAVTAACLVMRRALYQQIGGLDAEHLTVAFNDVDLCLRLHAAGYLNVWTPYAELIHHESVSRGAEDTPEKQAREAGEIAYMRWRWGARLLADPYYSPNLTLDSEDFALAWPPRRPIIDRAST